MIRDPPRFFFCALFAVQEIVSLIAIIKGSLMARITTRAGQVCLLIFGFTLQSSAAEIIAGTGYALLTPIGSVETHGAASNKIAWLSGLEGPQSQLFGTVVDEGQILYSESRTVTAEGATASASAYYSGEIQWNKDQQQWGFLAMNIYSQTSATGVDHGDNIVTSYASINAQAYLQSKVEFDLPVNIRGFYGGNSDTNLYIGNTFHESGRNFGGFEFTNQFADFRLQVGSENFSRTSWDSSPPPNSYNYLINDRDSGNAYTHGFIIWGVGTVPGETPSNPLLPNLPSAFSQFGGTIGEGDGSGGSIGVGSGFTFGIPVTGSYGHTAPIFIDPVYAEGYDYATTDINFASVLIPSPLSGGDGVFELLVNGNSYELLAGQTFDFTTLDFNGVAAFSIRGIDPDEMLDPTDPTAFVTGLTFASEGATIVTMVAAIPEPTTILALAACGIGWAWCRRRRKK